MVEKYTVEQIDELIVRDTPKTVQTIELGGDYYFKCGWISCNSDVTMFDNFCPKCGQRLDFPIR